MGNERVDPAHYSNAVNQVRCDLRALSNATRNDGCRSGGECVVKKPVRVGFMLNVNTEKSTCSDP